MANTPLVSALGNVDTIQQLREVFTAHPHGVDFDTFKQAMQSIAPALARRITRRRRSIQFPDEHTGTEDESQMISSAVIGSDGGRRWSRSSTDEGKASPGIEKSQTIKFDFGDPTMTEVHPRHTPVALRTSFQFVDSSGPVSPIESKASILQRRCTDTDGSMWGAGATAPALDLSSPLQEDEEMHRPARIRQLSRAELDGTVEVEPLKQLFIQLDHYNEHAVTWDQFLQYLVNEACADTASIMSDGRPYRYSRQRAGRPMGEERKNIDVLQEGSFQAQLHKRQSPTGGAPTKEEREREKIMRMVPPSTRNKYGGRGSAAKPPRNPLYQQKDLSLIRYMDALPEHKQVFAISTRFVHLALFSKSTLRLVKSMTLEELGGIPTLVSYLPQPDLFITYSLECRSLRGWISLLVPNIPTLVVSPLRCDGTVRRLRTRSQVFPYSFFMCTSYGEIIRVDVPRSRNSTVFTIGQVYEDVHSRDSGGVIDFVMNDTHIFSTGFDHRLISLNIATGQRIVIGVPSVTVRMLAYSDACGLVIAATCNSTLLSWDARAQGSVPGATFHVGNLKNHASPLVGLACSPDLPQVISADRKGVVKVWDLRLQACIQSTRADGLIQDELDPDVIYGERIHGQHEGYVLGGSGKLKSEQLTITSVCYFDSTREIVSASTDGIYCLQFNRRQDPHICDLDIVGDVFYDVREKALLLRGPTRLTTWDAAHGYRKRVVDRAVDREIPVHKRDISAVCIDDLSSRLFLALPDGTVEVHSTVEHNIILDVWNVRRGAVTELIYCSTHSLLVGITNRGDLILRSDSEQNPTFATMNMSSTALFNLTISDELGLLAFSDDLRRIIAHDYKQVGLPSYFLKLSKEPLCVIFLGQSAPVMATAHDPMEVILWSCPPAKVGFAPLTAINIAQQELVREPIRYTCLHGTAVLGHGHGITSSNHHHVRHNVSRVAASTFVSNIQLISSGSGSGAHSPQLTRPFTSVAATEMDSLYPSGSKANLQSTVSEECSETLAKLLGNEKRSDTSSSSPLEITDMAYDEGSHRLFVGDEKGHIHVFGLCNLFQIYRLEHCTFENRATFEVELCPGNYERAMPQHFNTTTAHNGSSVLCLKWFPMIQSLVSSGANCSVDIMNNNGDSVSWLSMSRLRPSTKKAAQGSLDPLSCSATFILGCDSELPPFILPIVLAVGRPQPRDGTLSEPYCTHDLPSPVEGGPLDEILHQLRYVEDSFSPSFTQRATLTAHSLRQTFRNEDMSNLDGNKSQVQLADFLNSTRTDAFATGTNAEQHQPQSSPRDRSPLTSPPSVLHPTPRPTTGHNPPCTPYPPKADLTFSSFSEVQPHYSTLHTTPVCALFASECESVCKPVPSAPHLSPSQLVLGSKSALIITQNVELVDATVATPADGEGEVSQRSPRKQQHLALNADAYKEVLEAMRGGSIDPDLVPPHPPTKALIRRREKRLKMEVEQREEMRKAAPEFLLFNTTMNSTMTSSPNGLTMTHDPLYNGTMNATQFLRTQSYSSTVPVARPSGVPPRRTASQRGGSQCGTKAASSVPRRLNTKTTQSPVGLLVDSYNSELLRCLKGEATRTSVMSRGTEDRRHTAISTTLKMEDRPFL